MNYLAPSKSRPSKNRGMTLIEVLIASLILFMAIGLSASVFRQSALLQTKVLDQVERSELRTLVEPQILFELQQGNMNGEIQMSSTRLVSWSATDESNMPFVDSYTPEGSSLISSRGNVHVYHIAVSVSDKPNWLFDFRELLWRA